MNTITCKGLDGANPLHFLTALGVLRLLSREDARSRLCWRWEVNGWRPILQISEHSGEDVVVYLSCHLAAWLNALATTGNVDANLNRAVNDLKAKKKKLADVLKSTTKEAKTTAKNNKLAKTDLSNFVKTHTSKLHAEIEKLDTTLRQAQNTLGDALGLGIAHLGEIIGVKPDLFRRKAEAALSAFFATPRVSVVPSASDAVLVVGQMAALACDQVPDGDTVRPTPFSFSNGSSGQCLLKDFRNCAKTCTSDRITASLFGNEAQRFVAASGLTSLNWDPHDLRSYALNWEDPAGMKAGVDVACNALAYVGLGTMTVAPGPAGHLTTVAWDQNRAFRWPLWEPFLNLDVISSMLAGTDLMTKPPMDRQALQRRGISEIREARRDNPNGKRNFFAPSHPV